MKEISVKPNNQSAKIINYVIWGGVIATIVYLLYRRTDAFKQSRLNNLVKQYPGWEVNNGKKTTPVFMYAKPFKAYKADGSLEFEAWLIFYNTGVVKIYTRGKKEELILQGTYDSAKSIKVDKGFKVGKSFKGSTINDMLTKIFEQKITGI
jgi:hypothetical protein